MRIAKPLKSGRNLAGVIQAVWPKTAYPPRRPAFAIDALVAQVPVPIAWKIIWNKVTFKGDIIDTLVCRPNGRMPGLGGQLDPAS